MENRAVVYLVCPDTVGVGECFVWNRKETACFVWVEVYCFGGILGQKIEILKTKLCLMRINKQWCVNLVVRKEKSYSSQGLVKLFIKHFILQQLIFSLT